MNNDLPQGKLKVAERFERFLTESPRQTCVS